MPLPRSRTPPLDACASASPARLLMTTDTVGGVWTYSLTLAGEFEAVGVQVTLVTMGPPASPDQRRAAAAIAGLKLARAPFRLEWMEGAAADFAAAGRWLLELERKARPDIVHLNSYHHAALPWQAPVVAAAHSCVRSWWRACRGTDAPAAWKGYGARTRDGLRAAAAVVAPSRSFLDEIERLYGPFRDGRVIANGAVPKRFLPQAKEPFVLAAGRLWDEAKNLALLEAAAALLPEDGWPIRIAGEAASPDGGCRAPGTGVQHLGRLAPDKLARLMGRAGIFTAPARYEPFGLAVLEAALAGCALVLADIPSFKELWQGAALFVPSDDAAALAATLQGLAADTGRRRELAHLARQRALQRYTATAMASGYCRLYGELLAADGAAVRRCDASALVGSEA